MNVREEAFPFDCAGESLIGIIARPQNVSPSAIGVVIVVGGPQYRVGSHRQFVSLSRFLAAHGVPCMRFDYRGMGDATGEQRSFEDVGEDIRAAIDAFQERVPGIARFVLWGLCDGASAACLYAPADERVAALVLLNPWIGSEAGAARTKLKHYYLRRLFDPGFWRKLVRGGVKLASTAGELAATIKARGGGDGDCLVERMAAALSGRAVPFAVFLSDRDYVAREFDDMARRSKRWRRLLEARPHERTRRFDADHTFSSAASMSRVAEATLESVQRLCAAADCVGAGAAVAHSAGRMPAA